MFCWIVLIQIITKTITKYNYLMYITEKLLGLWFFSEKHGKVIVSLHQKREEENMPRIGNKFMILVAMR